MIGYLRGEIADITEELLVLEVGGIGYNIKISANTAQLLHGRGEDVKIYTHLSVREDAMQLYGFLTKDDLDFFRLLIGVNGIGPKGGQAILSAIRPDDLRFAILSGDAKTISKAPGIGAKTAQRIILDLKDKISLEDAFEQKLANEAMNEKIGESQSMGSRKEAIEALVALGYSNTDALKAVKSVELTENMDSETILKQALKKMTF